MMSEANNEPPAVGDPGKLGRGQPVAALEDFDKTPPERERSVRETCSAPNPRFHRLNPGRKLEFSAAPICRNAARNG
jgi:hypothetical protein